MYGSKHVLWLDKITCDQTTKHPLATVTNYENSAQTTIIIGI